LTGVALEQAAVSEMKGMLESVRGSLKAAQEGLDHNTGEIAQKDAEIMALIKERDILKQVILQVQLYVTVHLALYRVLRARER
jgi:hypothetical protein